MASHQVGGDIASRSIVNAEISRTDRRLEVGNKSHYVFSRLAKAFQFVDDRRNVLADDGKSIQSSSPTFDGFHHGLIEGGPQAFNLQKPLPITVLLFLDSRQERFRKGLARLNYERKALRVLRRR